MTGQFNLNHNIPSSTILFPLSVITWMRGSWLAILAWMTWCLFRRFLEAIRSLPRDKNNFKVIVVVHRIIRSYYTSF